MTAVLAGFTIGITADRRADEQMALFERRGAAVPHGPAIRTHPLGDDDELRAATEAVVARPPHLLIANTGIGMRSWFGAAETWDQGDELLAALGRSQIFARGPKAAGACHSLGLEVAGKAETEQLDDCIELVLAVLQPGQRVVLQRDGGDPPPAAERLRAAGAEVLEVPVYRWRPVEDPKPALRLVEAVLGERVQAVTFTAAPAVTSWLAIADEHDIGDALRARLRAPEVVVGCVGPVCAAAAEAAGLGTDLVQPRTFRLGPLVRAVAERLLADAPRLGPLMLTGTVARVDDRLVELTLTEAQVLGALLARAGGVMSKADLLRTVWGDPDGDPHVVEVAVGRLRRRLGEHGSLIHAVPRRGYALRVPTSVTR
ncbi:MAG: uroporphyrinogen-III synthase [Actinomycetota bacterium]